MNSPNETVTIVVPGDLHLTTREQPNYAAAVFAVREINRLIHPDFVQFIGDNVQDAADDQFQLFQELSSSLAVPHFALVGDHDICGDKSAKAFRQWVGECYSSLTVKGFRCLRLNTLDVPRLGFDTEQLAWLADEFQMARLRQERVVVFQHHYPYKVCEEFSGPGIDRWRELMAEYRPVAIVSGHTHYFQMANNGQYPVVAVRSIGDPEGGQPGYLIVHLCGNDFAVAYRTIEDSEPVILITHPCDVLLATDARHVIHSDTDVRVRIWSSHPVCRVIGTIDHEFGFELQALGSGEWSAPLAITEMIKGEHVLEIHVELNNGTGGRQDLRFMVDPTRRYTAVPDARPVVRTTVFC